MDKLQRAGRAFLWYLVSSILRFSSGWPVRSVSVPVKQVEGVEHDLMARVGASVLERLERLPRRPARRSHRRLLPARPLSAARRDSPVHPREVLVLPGPKLDSQLVLDDQRPVAVELQLVDPLVALRSFFTTCAAMGVTNAGLVRCGVERLPFGGDPRFFFVVFIGNEWTPLRRYFGTFTCRCTSSCNVQAGLRGSSGRISRRRSRWLPSGGICPASPALATAARAQRR